MMLSKWTFFQMLVIVGLGVVAFVAEQFSSKIAVPSISANQQGILTLSFILIVVGLLSLLLFFQTKKSETFLVHRLWQKMPILLLIILSVSIVAMIALVNPITELVERFRFVLYVIIYYIIYLTNLLVVSFVHKNADSSTTNERKVSTGFWWTCFIFVALQFIL